MSAEENQRLAWSDIVEACQDVSVRADPLILELAATTLAQHRVKTNRAIKRTLHRLLKECLIPDEAAIQLMREKL